MPEPSDQGTQHDDLQFYRPDDPWGEFSNFSHHPVEYGGVSWPTSEHLFQAQKFDDPSLRERIRAAPTPWDAAQIGRDRSLPLRPDWEKAKDDVMRAVLRAKFTQHSKLRELLLSTGHRRLVEHTTNDSYWGDGGGRGRNMLGLLLTELREDLRTES